MTININLNTPGVEITPDLENRIKRQTTQIYLEETKDLNGDYVIQENGKTTLTERAIEAYKRFYIRLQMAVSDELQKQAKK